MDTLTGVLIRKVSIRQVSNEETHTQKCPDYRVSVKCPDYNREGVLIIDKCPD